MHFGLLICFLLRQVTLGKVLKVIVVMRSLFIDRTIVKGYHENVYTEDGKVQSRIFVPRLCCVEFSVRMESSGQRAVCRVLQKGQLEILLELT
ncbi:hypothetical protein lerEdw1_016425 [Lerista edwardsae]|nr:hypothetical protein lerEdw1_016425 [Lerista edwardsae]